MVNTGTELLGGVRVYGKREAREAAKCLKPLGLIILICGLLFPLAPEVLIGAKVPRAGVLLHGRQSDLQIGGFFNLKTAAQIALAIPPEVLYRAEKVIK